MATTIRLCKCKCEPRDYTLFITLIPFVSRHGHLFFFFSLHILYKLKRDEPSVGMLGTSLLCYRLRYLRYSYNRSYNFYLWSVDGKALRCQLGALNEITVVRGESGTPNVGILLGHYVGSQPRRPPLESSLLGKPYVLQ
jgi:hypothetical protein